MTVTVLAIVVVLVCYLIVYHRRARSRVKAERGAMFDPCLPLFDDYRLKQDGVYFPVLRGHYRGYDMTLEPIADHAGFRTLPSLWVLVSLRGQVPFSGIFDYLRRPRNVEFYSPSWNLERDIVIPDGWPKDGWLRTDRPEDMPPIELMDPHMGLFDDPRSKELLVTPKGVRIVYQAHEAIRSYYMLLRQVKFEDITIGENLARALMDRAISLYEDINEEARSGGRQSEETIVKA